MATKEKKPKTTGGRLKDRLETPTGTVIIVKKKKKSMADLLKNFNGISDFKTGQEVLDDFEKYNNDK